MPLQLKIDVKKLKKDWFFNANSGAVYADLNVYENDELDQYGNSHVIKQNPDKASREAGAKAHIVGNGKVWGNQQRQAPPARKASPPKQEYRPLPSEDSDEIPF